MTQTDPANNPNAGNEIDTDDSAVPPYAGRSTESTNSRDIEATAGKGHGGKSDAPEPVNPEVASEEAADAGDLPPKGVGESAGRRGEDIRDEDGKEAGRHDEATEGHRPAGSSDDRDRTGI